MSKKYLTREEFLESEYSMLQEIHNCCEANGLTYYLAYGTLIGAVRHKGFIPWDDDLDIMMPVQDYVKLRDKYQSDRYFITDSFHDDRHDLCFPRIYDGKTCMDGHEDTLGVHIDIYLMHGAPDSQVERAKLALNVMRLRNIRQSYNKWRGRIARHIFPSLWKQNQSIIVKILIKKQYNVLSRYKIGHGKMLYAYGGDGLTEFFWKDFFDEKTLLQFNGGVFYAPRMYNEVLATTYGDYMELPPEDQRKPYHESNIYTWKNS